MDASCALTHACDSSTEVFGLEVPITNISLETGAVDVLFVEKNEVARSSKNVVSNPDSDNNLKDAEISIESDRTGTKNGDVDRDKVANHEIVILDEADSDNIVELDGNKIDLDVIALDRNKADSDVIVLDGNKADSDVIVLYGNKADSDVILLDGKTDSESTIILDEDFYTSSERPTKNINIVDVEKDDCSIVDSSMLNTKKRRTDCNELYKVNSLLRELIEKCLDMENAGAMNRVINRTLLAIYKDVDESYKISDAFRKFLTGTIMQLDLDPQRKFSHIKNLCEELKMHKVKKRVPFITLDDGKDKDQPISSIPKKKRKVDVVIDLDEETGNDDIQHNIETQTTEKQRRDILPIGKVYPPIDLADSSGDDIIVIDKNDYSNKENSRKRNSRKRKKYRRKTRSKNIVRVVKQTAKKRVKKVDLPKDLDISDPLLEPRLSVEVNVKEFNQEKIIAIETRIAVLKKKLEKLEEAEVITDCNLSPYVLCEQVKASIVRLYRELCTLTDTEATKRHEVRLQVVTGHPEGPVRCLEKFLNENIDEDGNPPFPDMNDVVNCVYEANYKYNMNWSRTQIMNEAHALFTQFGRSMQKRRQKREWKDLMSLVKNELADPAEEDLALQARLMENTRVARKNEEELLERFAKMEHGLSAASQLDPELRLNINQSDDSDENSDIEPQDTGGNTQSSDLGGSSADIVPNVPRIRVRSDLGLPKETVNVAEQLRPSGAESCNNLSICNIVCAIEPEPVCSGRIVVQQSIDGVTQNQMQIENTKPSNDRMSLYSAAYKSFVLNSCKPVETLPAIRCHPRKTPKHTIEKSNENYMERAADIAKQILSQVQSDLGTNTNGLSKEKYNLVNTSYYAALETFNPTVKLAYLNPNVFAKYNQEKRIPNGALENDISKQNGESSGLQTFWHSCSSKDNHNTANELNTHSERIAISGALNTCGNFDQKETDKKGERKDVATTADITNKNSDNTVAPELIWQTEDTRIKDSDSDAEDIVKPEPLDIPSMLEELGQGFTATIFDIEDPFLVIEISDSSESEDEGA